MNNNDFYSRVVLSLTHIYKSKLQQDRLDSARISEFDTQQVKPLFPYKTFQTSEGQIQYQKYPCSDVCCEIDFGNFCCGKTNVGSKQLNELGLGISLYMKFVSYLIWFFLIVAFLVGTSLFLYYSASLQNKSLVQNLTSVLFSSTIGSLTSNLYQCQYTVNGNKMSFEPICKAGNIKIYDPVYSNKSFANVQACQLQISNSLDSINKLKSISMSSNCTSYSCSVQVNNLNPENQHLFVSLGYSCLNPSYKLAGYQTQNKVIILIIVGIDLIVLLLFIFWMFMQSKSQKELIRHFNSRQISLQDFTLQLKGFSIRGQLLETIVSDFIREFGKTVVNLSRQDITIAKFKVCDNVEKISNQYKKKELYQKIFSQKFQKMLLQGIDPTELTLEQFSNQVDFHEFRKDIEKFLKQFKQYQYGVKNQPYCVFITLESPEMVNNVLKLCQHSCITGKSTLKINKKPYKIKKACRPDLIQWENLNSHYIIRTILSWVITLSILVLSYLMIAAAQIGQTQILNKFDFNINCGLLYNDNSLESWSQTLKSDNNWVNCYCSSHLSEVFSYDQCKSWLKNYSFYLFSPMFISLLIVIFNMIVSFIFKKLSKFQKHSNICSQLYSYIIKRSLLLILNAGFILIIVNQKLQITSQNPFVNFLFGGRFNNFDAGWYYGIGQVIIFTNLFNIIMPMFEVVIQSLIKCLLKMIDTKCCRKRTSATSKQNYLNIYSGIPFPIEERYAEIISLLVLTFAYNSVIPILNIVALLSFLFQYMSDKVMIFYVYKKPPNYDHTLQKMVRNTLIFCIIIHLFTSIFFLPTQGIDWNSGLNLNIGTLNSNSTIKLIASQIYIYPYLCMLALVIIWIIFRNTLIRFFECCFKRCQNKQQNYYSVEKNSLKVYDLYTNPQIQQLLKVNRAQLVKAQDELDMYNYKKGINQTIQDLVMGSVFRIVVDHHGQIQIPGNWEKLSNYRKILFQERAQLKGHLGQRVKVKLNGLPGYDPIFEKDTHLVEVSRLQKVVRNYYEQVKQ